VKPAPFAYHRPSTVEEALATLAAHGPEAKALAGGQSLIPAMNFRLAKPAVLVDLNGVTELAFVRAGNDGTRIGAMARQRTVERDPMVGRAVPLLAEALPHVAHAQIRNRGTIGGSVAHADPAGEIGAVLLALGARFVLRGPAATRTVPADGFYTGLFATALEPGELLVEVIVPPAPPRTGWSFLEVARRHGDYALAGVAATVALDEAGRCRDARIALLGVAEGPVLATRAAKALAGERPTEKVFKEAAGAAAAKDIEPPGDIHASAAYRRQLVAVLTRRALATACERGAARGPGS
jgi:carbon-monoxide dehydrogenase medium subunit